MFSLIQEPIMRCQKGFGDIVNLKALYNPIGNLKDAAKSKNLVDGLALAGGFGKGIAPTVINKSIRAAVVPNSGEYYYGIEKDRKAAADKREADLDAAWKNTDEYKAGIAPMRPRTDAERRALLARTGATGPASTILGNTNSTGRALL
jgi:hypothetical protein